MTPIFTNGVCRAKRRTYLHTLRGKFASEVWPDFTFSFTCSYCLLYLYTTNRINTEHIYCPSGWFKGVFL
jgi:hypothetical protein